MAGGQRAARSYGAPVAVAPFALAAMLGASLLAGSLLGAGAEALLAGAERYDIARRAAAEAIERALIDVRTGERESAAADARALAARLAETEAALVDVRAGERASEVSLEDVLVQIRAGERLGGH